MKQLIGYLIIMLLFCCLFACKKTATSPYPADTFFKVYNAPIAKGTGTNTTTNFSGPTVVDDSGNIYMDYYNQLLAKGGGISILKTDKYGKMVWNKNIGPFYTYSVGNVYYIHNIVCIGETLYLSLQDTANNFTILKFNCPDGRLTGQIPLNGLLPAGANAKNFYITGIWPTNEGNILVNGYFAGEYYKPLLAMVSPNGNIIWANSQFPFPLNDNIDLEEGSCITELADGSFMFGTLGERWIDITTFSEVETITLNFYHLSSSGSLLSADSLAAGGHIGYFNSPARVFLDSNVGEVDGFFVFPAPQGGYIIAGVELYNSSSYRIKIIKTDASFHALDSSYIAPANSNLNISGIIQKADGTIVLSVYDEQLPITNDLSYLYEISPDISIKKTGQVGSLSQSVYMSGMTQTNDGHIVMGGMIQTNGLDTNNIFILKTDENEHY